MPRWWFADRFYPMEISLDRLWKRAAYWAAVGLPSLALLIASGRAALADYWIRSSDVAHWERAATLAPRKASYQRLLGSYRLMQGDTNAAIRHFQRASEIDPHSAEGWTQLAYAYQAQEKPEQAEQAFRRAVEAHPISPEVGWWYGNFLLAQGRRQEAIATLRRVIETDGERTRQAVDIVWRATGDVALIADSLLPRQSSYLWTAVGVFLRQNEVDAALALWPRLLQLEHPLEMEKSLGLLEALIRLHRWEDAGRTWWEALAAAGLKAGGAEGSLVWNGGFERDFLRGGFAWRQPPIAGATVSFDSETRTSGRRSLRIDFDGSANLDFQNVYQYVLVEPANRYRFASFFHAREISTDSGLQFRIYDPENPAAVDVWTPNVVGTVPWTKQEVEFVTGRNTRVVLITLRRLPSRKFDNKLRGTVWVDEVSLVPFDRMAAREMP